jgi:hypothetical protein
MQWVCHGVLLGVLGLMYPGSSLAGGAEPSKRKAPTYQEDVLSTHKASLDVEWEINKISDSLSHSKNLYQITILAPAVRHNVTLLVKDKPVAYISPSLQNFKFDFSSYPVGELEVTLLMFDSVKAGISTKTIEVVDGPGVPKTPKK